MFDTSAAFTAPSDVETRFETAFESSAAFTAPSHHITSPSGLEPCLGGELRLQAIWVDEKVCVGCRYCAHVATNTFLMDQETGKCRAIRQDGDSTMVINEAIDTCPVDCIHWISFEELIEKKKEAKVRAAY